MNICVGVPLNFWKGGECSDRAICMAIEVQSVARQSSMPVCPHLGGPEVEAVIRLLSLPASASSDMETDGDIE